MPPRRSPAAARDGADVATVHRRLRAAILLNELEPGAVIAQGTLSTAYDAGRTPLREALRMLQREGLVISEPNRPVQIASLSAEDFEAVSLMRVALEVTAIQITVPTLDTDDLADLEGFMARMEHYQRTGDQRGFRAPHRAFHDRLVTGSGARVATQIDELADHSQRYRLRFGDAAGWRRRGAEHRDILNAAAGGDAGLAARLLAEHYAGNANVTLTALDPDYEPWRLRTGIAALAPGAEDGRPSRSS